MSLQCMRYGKRKDTITRQTKPCRSLHVNDSTKDCEEYKVDTPVVLTQGVFKTLQTEFHWALQDLGSLAFYQSISQAVSGLVWGYLADRSSRIRLLAMGCCSWGVVTMLMATGTQYWQFAFLKILNGIALASVGPVAQSLIADLFPASMRGEQFGWLQLFLCGGCIAGALMGGSMANLYIIEGVRGWRLAFFLSGVFSVFAGLLVRLLAAEPPRHLLSSRIAADKGVTGAKRRVLFHSMYHRCRTFLRALVSHTFLILLLQGICGYIPMHAFQFYTMFFQYVGMPDWQASVLTACPLIGGMAGSLFGGWLGDRANEWNRFHGRPLVGQAATLLAIPLIYVGLLVIPRRPEFFGLYAVDMLLLGFAIASCPTGTNRPILSEIVESEARASVFATQIVVEGSVASLLGSPVITFMAESMFGYSGTGGPELRARNLEALANALLVATVFPWTICFFMYGLLHFTYEKDVRKSLDGRYNQLDSSDAATRDVGKAYVFKSDLTHFRWTLHVFQNTEVRTSKRTSSQLSSQRSGGRGGGDFEVYITLRAAVTYMRALTTCNKEHCYTKSKQRVRKPYQQPDFIIGRKLGDIRLKPASVCSRSRVHSKFASGVERSIAPNESCRGNSRRGIHRDKIIQNTVGVGLVRCNGSDVRTTMEAATCIRNAPRRCGCARLKRDCRSRRKNCIFKRLAIRRTDDGAESCRSLLFGDTESYEHGGSPQALLF
ncbi:uncharacterized protein LOC131479426, partial [Ochotona princeps]|uniref:uncharacterized protein LOC131479426 n=1 Tax=Ochotona princeps TaxID=9978 RepID=UPI002715365E